VSALNPRLILTFITCSHRSTHLVKYLLAKTIELLSSDYNSFQTSHSSSLSKSSLLIDKTFLEDSVKMTQDQLAGFQVQCEKNWDGLKRDKEKLVGEETRENQVSFCSLVRFVESAGTNHRGACVHRGKLWEWSNVYNNSLLKSSRIVNRRNLNLLKSVMLLFCSLPSLYLSSQDSQSPFYLHSERN